MDTFMYLPSQISVNALIMIMFTRMKKLSNSVQKILMETFSAKLLTQSLMT